MGLFGNQPKKKHYANRIAELDAKIEQLEAVGMTASAARLREERRKFDKDILEKTKAMTPKEIKAQMRSAKAEGLAK